jgi:hypothetical protein
MVRCYCKIANVCTETISLVKKVRLPSPKLLCSIMAGQVMNSLNIDALVSFTKTQLLQNEVSKNTRVHVLKGSGMANLI